MRRTKQIPALRKFIYFSGVRITLTAHNIERKKPPIPPNIEDTLCLTILTSLSHSITGKCKLMAIPYTQENRIMMAGINSIQIKSDIAGFIANIINNSDKR